MNARTWMLTVLFVPTLVLAQEDLGALLGRARTARDQGRMAEAVQAYDAMLAQVPAHETALLERAQTLSWMGRYPEALSGYRAFKEHFPAQALKADLRTAQVLAWSDDTGAALDVLAPWVKEGQAQAVLDDATYRAWRGELRGSLSRLEEWLKLHPGDREAMLAKARFRSWTGQLKVARREYEEVLVEHPGDGEALLGLARLALWVGDPAEARARLEHTTPETRRSPDGQMLEAQCRAAEGRRRASAAILKELAAGGPSQRDARDALEEQVSTHGPWAELRYSRTDTSEGLMSDLPMLRARIPVLEGHAQVELGRWRSSLLGQERQSTVLGASVAQALGSRLTVSAGIQRNTGAPGMGWNAGAGAKLLPGLRLQLDFARSLLDFTPTAVDHRGSILTADLGLSWSPGDGLDVFSLGGGVGSLSAGSHRLSGYAGYERRVPLSWVELRAGAVGRIFGYSETLSLGFFNPERFRYVGLTAAATFKRARQLLIGVDLRGGVQRVNDDPAQFAWGYGLSAEWLLLEGRLALFGSWSHSIAGLPVTQPADPEHYREHTFVVGVRGRGKVY